LTAPPLIASLALFGVGVFTLLVHAYWALAGGGHAFARCPFSSDGTPGFVPGKPATWAVTLLLCIAAFILLEWGGLGPGLLPESWRTTGSGLLSAGMLMRGIGDFHYVGIFKRVRQTRLLAWTTCCIRRWYSRYRCWPASWPFMAFDDGA
jgi:Protein of unknown function (DUF3995)